MHNDYLPGSLNELGSWLKNFDGMLMSQPSRFDVPAGELGAWHEVYLAYVAARRTANEEATRTRGTVAAERSATEAVTRRARELVAGIQARRATTEGDRAGLRITPRRPRRRRVGQPVEAPRMTVGEVRGRRVVLLVDDAGGEGHARRRRRPAGVKGVQVFRAMGERMPMGWKDWSLAKSTNETKLVVEVEATVELGARVWWTARWVNARSEPGPACLPVEVRVNSGW